MRFLRAYLKLNIKLYRILTSFSKDGNIPHKNISFTIISLYSYLIRSYCISNAFKELGCSLYASQNYDSSTSMKKPDRFQCR